MDQLQTYLHEESFAGFISFASGDEKMIAAFEKDTGQKISLPNSPIEAMIDEQSGYRRDFVVKFIDWCAGEYGREFLPDDLSIFMKPEEST